MQVYRLLLERVQKGFIDRLKNVQCKGGNCILLLIKSSLDRLTTLSYVKADFAWGYCHSDTSIEQ